MTVYLINNGSGLINELITLLEPYEPIIIDRDKLSNFYPNDNDLLILSGGHEIPILWHNKEYADELNLVINHKGPIIGICLGFEIITHAYGGHLHKLSQRLHRVIDIFNVDNNNIVPEDTQISVFESHIWSVAEVSSPLIALAESDEGVEIIKHESKPIYGLQFHPEHVIESNGYLIFEKIINEIYGN